VERADSVEASPARAAIGAVGGIRALVRLVRQVEKALADVEVSVPQFRALSMLAEGSSASSALAHRLAVSPPTVTAVVDGLVARELVRREADADDRRKLTLLLTDDGRTLLGAAQAAIEARLDQVAAHLDDPTVAADALAALVIWNDALDRFREEKTAAGAT
jgi:long-chain acyl-CoA synthetase